MSISVSIIVVSDRVHEGLAEDASGSLAKRMVEEKGFFVEEFTAIPNSHRELLRVVRTSKSRLIIFIGGTGPGPRDITVDVVSQVAWRHLPGFGELFRAKSFEVKGFRGILTRSELFILPDGRIAVCLPGSPGSVELGLNILLNIIEHLVEEVDRFEGQHN
ncbi:MAG: MogA/MoaB family molybdenum cofactor biosynthesis protein [Thermosphaera aggregans]|jgi:molybdenum cofactor biosynthesis protein B|uniref:MogA/MoaB family molybdenum cofactor biosynthesis protein n=1 Tax=Thermosphaera aggregans TaxID=54254 RepID=UPI003C06DFAB